MGDQISMLNAMTIDVEEYFQVSAFERVVARDAWDGMSSRLEASVERVLERLSAFDVLGTFFVLGWIAERHPDVVRNIASCGHEVGCHGYDHKLLYDLDRECLFRETDRSRKALQDLTGQPVLGYRAASFSIGLQNLWALDVLVEAGFAYDSSIFPIIHDRYGIPNAPRRMHRLSTPLGGSLIELPPSTLSLGWWNLPVAGGGYLRLLPAWLTNWAVQRLNRRDQMPAVVYLHPWELDPEQPRIDVGRLAGWRHYNGIASVGTKLEKLMESHRFGPAAEVIEASTTFSLDRTSDLDRVNGSRG